MNCGVRISCTINITFNNFEFLQCSDTYLKAILAICLQLNFVLRCLHELHMHILMLYFRSEIKVLHTLLSNSNLIFIDSY